MASDVSSRLPWPWVPTRRHRAATDPFFDEGNMVCSLYYKQMKDSDSEEAEDEDLDG